jgi:monoamine oxidase
MVLQDNTTSVIIVGAGLAGLCTAYELKRNGIACRIFEADTRLGGRVLSVPHSRATSFDLGGELISTHHHHWMRYAKEFGLTIVDSGFYCGTAVVSASGALLSSSAVSMLDAEFASCGLVAR